MRKLSGAWYGNGRKAEKGFLSPILFAVYDEDDGVFRSISRCMSFTDAMYAAIKAFYFHGTPYPDDVGQTVDAAAKASSNQEGEAKSDGSGSEVDDEEGRDGEDMGTGVGDDSDSDENQNQFVGVNCFSARPPTSVYATNESPTIWFQPKEVWEVRLSFRATLIHLRKCVLTRALLPVGEFRGLDFVANTHGGRWARR